MDFHLNSLLNLPNTTVFTCDKEAGFIFLHLQLTNEGINCPNCQSYTDTVHQTSHILIRDLSIIRGSPPKKLRFKSIVQPQPAPYHLLIHLLLRSYSPDLPL